MKPHTRVKFARAAAGLLFAGLGAGSVFGSDSAGSFDVASPNGELRFVFTLARGGVPTYEIFDRGRPTVLASRLGLTTNHHVQGNTDWTDGFAVTDVRHSHADAAWSPPWGERATIPDRYNELQIDLTQGPSERGPLRIEVRAYDEGVAFRYAFPESRTTRVVELDGERSEFNLPTGTQAYWTPGPQRPYARRPLREWERDAELPVTLNLADGRWLSIAEAGQTAYTGARLRCVGTDRLVTQLFGDVTDTSPFATPWRIVLVADEPGRLLEHDYLVLNLNPPSELADTSWIHPGKLIREMTLSTDGARKLVDFAVEQKIEYILFDAGWYGYENDASADATRVHVDPRRNPRGDLDLPAMIRYAKSKGRRVILYVNHRALERQLDVLLPLYRAWGVDGVKFGFVHIGSSRWTVWLHDAVRKAAAHQLIVDIHDNYRPTGFSRTYPNLLTQEGILGNEAFPDATQNTILPFTRFLAGAADYTFCFNEPRLVNRKVHQLALSVIYFSPLQSLYWYGRPEDYPNREEVEFWKELPTTWDDTRVVAGQPGEFIVVARRSGADWWLGAVTNTEARALDVSFAFLPAGRTWLADIYEDAEPHRVVRRNAVVTAESILHFDLRASGGVAIRLHAQ
jgi:alpha-glucosidase